MQRAYCFKFKTPTSNDSAAPSARKRSMRTSWKIWTRLRQISTDRIRDCNEERPHEALGSLAPPSFPALIQ